MSSAAGIRSICGEGGIMHNYEAGPLGDPAQHSGYGDPEPPRRPQHSTFSLIAMIVVIAVAATVGLTVAFWALGFLFHLAGWILRVAVLAAVAAYVWRRVNRRWSHDRFS
jgi:hypothetical protein